MDFFKPPPGAFTLRNVTVPACLVGQEDGVLRRDISVRDGLFSDTEGQSIEMGGAMVLPSFVDMHTHLDKGHIWPRKPNPDGSFLGALTSVGEDRTARWIAEDVRRRMDFALRCAWAHGTRAVRTHLDSIPPQPDISYPVYRELAADWADRIKLQPVNLVPSPLVEPDGPIEAIADQMADLDGVLGLVTTPVWDLPERLRFFFQLASERGLAADFHVDETGDSGVATLRQIAEAVIETGFNAPVTVGHCCSLAVQDATEAERTMDMVARAGLNVVSLPMCNLYLQDRAKTPSGMGFRTPRWRGITLVHELKERGVNVSFASDNTRDPFFAYGDLDMVEVLREATRIGHLDHSTDDWVLSVLTNPARATGFAIPSLAVGDVADFSVFRARNWNEFLSRPQSDRVVIRNGKAIDRTLPDYSELDDLMEPA